MAARILKPAMILDDRGCEIRVREASREEKEHAYATLDEEASDRIEDAIEPSDHFWRDELVEGGGGWLICNCVAVLVAASIWLAIGRTRWSFIPAMVVGLTCGLLAARGWRKRNRRAGPRAFAQEGICPACEYLFLGASPESDGCVVCPECGGAWRIKSSRTLPDRSAP